jgi:glycosyltransferase involved in cell wall biosynthesis
VTVDLSVVVPVFENETTLDTLIDRQIAVLEDLGRSFELIFVDDGSRDGSLPLLRRRAAADPRIRVFALTRNFGGQSAICAGFDQVRGKRTVCMDADLENLPEDIPALLAALDRGHDLACGVREDRRDSFLFRRLPSALLNAWVRRQTGTEVRDVGCAMRAMDSSLVHDLASEGERRRLVTPLLLRRARAVTEVPIRHQPKGVPGGHTFLTLLGIAMDYYLLTAKRPFLVSGLVGASGLGVGALLLLASAALPAGAALFGLVLAVGGLVIALVSVAGEYAQRSYQLQQGIPFYQLREGAGSDEPPHERPRTR